MNVRVRVLVLAVALVLAPVAQGANVATPKMEQVASWAAGKPVSVWCESDSEAWSRMLARVGHIDRVEAYTYVGGSTVWLGPTVCSRLGSPGYPVFALGLSTLLHESWHARGHRDEAFAECAARVLIYSALHDFYGVPWYSARMASYTTFALNESLRRPAEYQGGCDRL